MIGSNLLKLRPGSGPDGTVATGFDEYNVRVPRQASGFALPNPPRDSQTFSTPSGKAQFMKHHLPDVSVEKDQFVLMTLEVYDQYNTTIYGLDDRYRGVKGNRRVLFMNADDMVERGWKSRQKVSITSHFEDEQRHSENLSLVPYELPRGNLAAYFQKRIASYRCTPKQRFQTRLRRNGLFAHLSSSQTSNGAEEE